MCRGWKRAGVHLLALLCLLPLGLQAHEPAHVRSDVCPDSQTPPVAPGPLVGERHGDRNDLLVEGFEGDFPPSGWAVIHLGDTYRLATVRVVPGTE